MAIVVTQPILADRATESTSDLSNDERSVIHYIRMTKTSHMDHKNYNDQAPGELHAHDPPRKRNAGPFAR